MTAPRPTGSIDIWNFVDNVTGTTVRKWLRDSWARRKIVALQQAVSSIVVPTRTSQLTNDSGYITQADVPPGSTASTTTPLMDGTASAGSATEWARGDHVHPHDTTKQDTLNAAQLAAANSGITANDLAVNDASVLCTVTPIIPTLNTGTHYSTYGGCWYYKIGSRVRLHIGVNGLTASTQTTLWTMPAGYRPKSGIAFTGQGSSSANYSRCRVTSAGEVWVNVSSGVLATAYCEYDAFS